MPNINFPANPTQGQEFTFNNFKYIYNSNRWQSARNDSSADLDNFIKDLGAPDSKVLVAGVEAKDFIDQKDGIPATAVIWFPSRDANHEGYIPADGQLLSRALYPSLWEAVRDNKVPVTSEAAWQAAVSNRGGYTDGDGSTTFRVPDYNGKSANAIGAAFLRGDGVNAGLPGEIQGDMIKAHSTWWWWLTARQNEEALSNIVQQGLNCVAVSLPAPVALDVDDYNPVIAKNQFGLTHATRIATAYDGGPETRPTNVTGVWMIKAFSYVENEGVVDAGHLATALADAEAKIAALESRKLTQIVETLWEGGVGHAGVILPVNSPLRGGDLISILHSDNNQNVTATITLVPEKMVAEQEIYFSFGNTASTSLIYVDENTFRSSHFTEGFGIRKIYRTRYVLS